MGQRDGCAGSVAREGSSLARSLARSLGRRRGRTGDNKMTQMLRGPARVWPASGKSGRARNESVKEVGCIKVHTVRRFSLHRPRYFRIRREREKERKKIENGKRDRKKTVVSEIPFLR